MHKIGLKGMVGLCVMASMNSWVIAKSFHEVIQESLSKNPDLLQQQALERAVYATKEQAEAGYYPSINVTGKVGPGMIKKELRPNTFSSGRVDGQETQTSNEVSLTLSQMIYDGNVVDNQVEATVARTKEAQKKVTEKQEGTVFQMLSAYVQVHMLRCSIKIAEENITLHEDILSKVDRLVVGGQLASTERDLAKSRLSDAREQLATLKGQLQQAIGDYVASVGEVPGELESLTIERHSIPKTLLHSIQLAKDYNQSLLLARATHETAKADLEVASVQGSPVVTIEMDATRAQNTEDITGKQYIARAQLVARYNIFDGGSNKGKREEARERMVAARLQVEQAKRSIEKEVRVAWSLMTTSEEKVAILKKAVVEKKDVSEGFSKQFDVGARSLLNILDVASEYIRAKQELVQTEADRDTGTGRLLLATGALSKTFKQ